MARESRWTGGVQAEVLGGTLSALDEATIEKGCDVGGTVIPPDDRESYMRLETDDSAFGHLCSWLCAIQFCASRAAEQRTTLMTHIDDLRQKESDRYPIGFYRPGCFGVL
jgi:hypothetical protein